MDRGAWQATVHGVTKSQTRLSNRAHTDSNKQRVFGGSTNWSIWGSWGILSTSFYQMVQGKKGRSICTSEKRERNKERLHNCGQSLSENVGEGDIEVLCIVLDKFL